MKISVLGIKSKYFASLLQAYFMYSLRRLTKAKQKQKKSLLHLKVYKQYQMTDSLGDILCLNYIQVQQGNNNLDCINFILIDD